MLITLEGVYKDGKVALAESPEGVRETKVLVTFLPESTNPSPRFIRFGQFAGPSKSGEDDFLLAEWRGEMDGNGH